MSNTNHKHKIPQNTSTEIIEAPQGSTPAVAYDYSAYAGAGFEDHTKDDYAVPFLGVLQALSPLVEADAKARPGMLVNTVTNEVFSGTEGVKFIPAFTQHVFIEWIPRSMGGGFVAVHQLNEEIVTKAKAEQEFGKYKMVKGDPKSNDLVETYYVYGVLITAEGSPEQIIIGFTSTKNKVYKQWMTRARTIQVPLPDGRRVAAPLFAHRYKITTVAQKNNQGSFYNYHIGYDGVDAESCRIAPNDPLFLQAVAFRDLIAQGSVKAAHETQAQQTVVEEAEVPFK